MKRLYILFALLLAFSACERPPPPVARPGPISNLAPGVRVMEVEEAGVRGRLYSPPCEQRCPALLVIGGSEGGIVGVNWTAASFANQGYAALALAYWREEGMPQSLEHIPLETFDRGLAWLMARPDVDAGRVGVVGLSRGSEAALMLAARTPTVRAVVAVSPSNVAGVGFVPGRPDASRTSAWTWKGKIVPWMRASDARPGGDAAIRVERISGPILLLSGTRDRLWPSRAMADLMVSRLHARDFPYEVRHLVYPDAGHSVFVGEPEAVIARGYDGAPETLGGDVRSNHAAWRDSWPKVVEFFERSLAAPT